jgi:Zn-finger nucleic acid-binding protein
MRRCHACSAPLLANSNICRYCHVRNDIDLHGQMDFTVQTNHSDRICPDCDIALQTIDLYNDGSLLIERCSNCFGLFFDPGEIETMLENSVSGVHHINHKLITIINRERSQHRKKVRYIKCPVCRQFMHRINFGHRSGVVIDQCKAHGIWLDNGEISHLLEWKKAGGQMLHEKRIADNKAKKTTHRKSAVNYDSINPHSLADEDDLLQTIGRLIFRVFS